MPQESKFNNNITRSLKSVLQSGINEVGRWFYREELHRKRLQFCMDSNNVSIAKTSSVTAVFLSHVVAHKYGEKCD